MNSILKAFTKDSRHSGYTFYLVILVWGIFACGYKPVKKAGQSLMFRKG